MTTIYIILGVVAVIVLWAIFAYNGFVRLMNRAEEAWADIDVQLKRRYDLIPNVVNTVKGYMTHERGTLEKVTEMRVKAMQAGSVGEHAQSENMLTEALKSLFAVAENYPDLKANQNFLGLQGDLTDTENKIQASRRFYNGNVRDFNTKLQVFPTNIIAGTMNFKAREFFDIDEKGPEGQPVKVQF